MKLKNYVIVGLVGVLTLFSSCADKYYETTVIEQGGNANLETLLIKVKKEDWKWNVNTHRYEVGYDLPEVDIHTVDKEAVLAHLFTYDGDVKVVKNLPFEQELTIDLEGSLYTFTRRIAYDYSDGYIMFYVENSDRDEDIRPWEDYEFKVVIIKNLDL